MKKQNSNLDEMQEQKLLKIEHNGCWFAFWALLASILIQTILFDDYTMRSITGEWIVFMSLSLYLAFSCLKNGIWDRKLKANGKNNVILSLISSLACAVIFSVSSYIKYDSLIGAGATGLFMFIFVFVSTLVALTITMKLYQKRVSKIDADCDE